MIKKTQNSVGQTRKLQ